MLLTLRRIRGAGTLCLLLAPVLACGLSACSIRYDESYPARRQAVSPETARGSAYAFSEADGEFIGESFDEDAGQFVIRESEPLPIPEPNLFGLRFDDSHRRRRQERIAASFAGDPNTVPSYKELRAARAAEAIERNINAKGGNTTIRPDGSSSKPTSVEFVAEPGALAMEIDASTRLNRSGGLPHSLVLVVYQLSDRTALDRLAATGEGMRKLLEGEMFDSSVKSARQIYIQPGMRNRLAMDRAEQGRYVALVAGYHHLNAAASLHVMTYGIGQYKTMGENELIILGKKKSMFVPLPLNLRVELGEGAMTVSEVEKIYRNMPIPARMDTQYYQDMNPSEWGSNTFSVIF